MNTQKQSTEPKQKKIESRKIRREKQNAVKLFNKLLFEFIKFESENTEIQKGFLKIKEAVFIKKENLNNQWRTFCIHARFNNKKKVGFKLNVLSESIDQHIDRHKSQVWTKYLTEVLQKEYGINMPMSAAGSYTDISKMPEEVAKSIYNNLKIMYKIEIPDIRFTKEIPENITEMTSDQFVFFAELLLKLYSKKIEVYDLKTAMALKFLGVKYSEKEYTGLPEQSREKISENINGLTELLDYFLVEKEGKLTVNTSFTKNLVPQLKIKHRPCLKGPADALTDINFLEYKDAGAAYNAYLKNQDEADLNELIAILYRPYVIPFVPDKIRQRWQFLSRKIKYKPWALKNRIKRIAKLPQALRFSIFLIYMASEDYLRNATLNIDGQAINLGILYETTLKEKQLNLKVKYKENTGLAGVALALASSGIFGPVAEVYKQNLYDVLLLLFKQRIEYLNQLEEIKK